MAFERLAGVTFSCLQLLQNLFVGWEAVGFMLRVDVTAVDFDVENATLALDEFGFDAGCLLDRVRQTGGLGSVISLHTVRYGNVHRFSFISERRKRAGVEQETPRCSHHDRRFGAEGYTEKCGYFFGLAAALRRFASERV